MAFDNGYLQGNEFPPGTDWITVGAYIRFSTIAPGTAFDFLRVSRDAAGEYHFALRQAGTAGEPGRLAARDANGSNIFLTGANVLSVDTWHLFEIKFKKSNSSHYRVWLDGLLISSGDSSDFDVGGTTARVEIRTQTNVTGPASPKCEVRVSSWYVRTDDGATIDTNNTRLGRYTVLGPFTWNHATAAGDYGVNLSRGNWNNTKDVPANDATRAEYSGESSGGVTAHDGAKPGPKGSEAVIDGNIVAAKWGWRAGKSGSGTSKFRGKYGKSTSTSIDNTVLTAERTLTVAKQNYWEIEDAGDANAPSKTDWFQIGFKKTTVSSPPNLQVSEMWTFLLHQEVEPAVFFGCNF